MIKIKTPSECGLMTECLDAGYFKKKILSVIYIRKEFNCDKYRVACPSCFYYKPSCLQPSPAPQEGRQAGKEVKIS
jgi:hypothetical protein